MLIFFQKGGLLMWPLLLLSVMTLALIAHRFFILKKVRAATEVPDCTSSQSLLEQLWQGIDHLGLIASIAPLIGLTGTVFGIIQCFDALGSGTPDTTLMAGGLSEALFTTAAGLLIAVPAQVAAHFLQHEAEKVEADRTDSNAS